jgi:GNAT superfamily N-acetyltransferase
MAERLTPPHSPGGAPEARRRSLIEFANHFRPPAAPGTEIIETPRYRVVLQPDYPIPGPNSATWIRCRPEEAADVIAEVKAIFRESALPCMWILDPETEPADFPERLAAHGIQPEPHAPEVAVMILPSDAHLAAPHADGVEMHDALADLESFRRADEVNAHAFGDPIRGTTPEEVAAQERRRQSQLAAGNRRMLLATVDGEPAGSSGLTLFPPAGAIINGGAVLERFRGRGVYRAMVVERLRMAREAGAAGLSVWGGPMSAPILERLGFEKVGWRRFYL